MEKRCASCHKKIKYRKLCDTCRKRNWRAIHPMEYAWTTFKSNAKSRNIPVELTFEQFKIFAIETDYIQKKGRTGTSYTIDRIENDVEKGGTYRVDNIRPLPNAENARKGSKTLGYDVESGSFRYFKLPALEEQFENEDMPFPL